MLNYREVPFSKVPAFDVIKERLALLYSSHILTKVGQDKSYDKFRIYVEQPARVRQPIDFSEPFLLDLASDPRDSRAYTTELLARLDRTIEDALRANDNV